MAQQLGALAVLVGDLGSVPNIYTEALHLCVTPVLGDPMPSSELRGHQAYMWCISIDIPAGKTLIHI